MLTDVLYYYGQLNIYQAGFPERGECSVISFWNKRTVANWIKNADSCPTVIFQGEMDKTLQSVVDSKKLATKTYGDYVVIAESEEELPDLMLFLETLETLKDVTEVEERMSLKFSPLSVEEAQEIIEEFREENQFVMVEGPLTQTVREWIEEQGFVVKNTRILVAISKYAEALPETNLMYALYAAELGIQIENWAIVTKET